MKKFWILWLALALAGCGGASLAPEGSSSSGTVLGNQGGGLLVRLSAPNTAVVAQNQAQLSRLQVDLLDPETLELIHDRVLFELDPEVDVQTVTIIDLTPGNVLVEVSGYDSNGNLVAFDRAPATISVGEVTTVDFNGVMVNLSLAFLTQPGQVSALEPLVPAPQVQLQDNMGRRVGGINLPITLTLANNPAGANLVGNNVVTSSGGVATFSGISLDMPGNGVTFQASAPGLSNAISSGFNVLPGGLTPGTLVLLGTVPTGNAPQLGTLSSNGDFFYVANFTDQTTGAYSVNSGTGLLTEITPFASTTPLAGVDLTAHPNGNFVFQSSLNAPTFQIITLSVAANGSSSVASAVNTSGTNPIGLDITPNGAFLFAANFGSDQVEGFSVAANGNLTTLGPVMTSGTVEEVRVHPNGNFLYTSSGDGFSIGAGGTLTPLAGFPVTLGMTPGSLDTNGTLLFINNKDSNNVSAFLVNTSNGALTPVSGSPFATGDRPVSGAIHPSGQFYFTANRNSSNVSSFLIGAGGGLTPVTGSPFTTGASPRSVFVHPNGNFLYTVNSVDNTVSIFAIAQ